MRVLNRWLALVPALLGGGVVGVGSEIAPERCAVRGGGRWFGGTGSLGKQLGQSREDVHILEDLLHLRQVLHQGPEAVLSSCAVHLVKL